MTPMTNNTITSSQIFHDAHVAGGWTEPDSITRRICTALWKTTGAFGRITNYHADVVLDYEILLATVNRLEPGQAFRFTYSVGDNGTHLAIHVDGDDLTAYKAHAKSVLDYDSGPATANFFGTVTRSDWSVSEYGQRYGADKYGLTIDSVTPSLCDTLQRY